MSQCTMERELESLYGFRGVAWFSIWTQIQRMRVRPRGRQLGPSRDIAASVL